MADVLIKRIDKRSVHQICSGQVILSLAVAVKELVENGLDAGATSIEVRLKDYGGECVEVADNGCGIEPSNFEALAKKHHTSKLREFEDLTSIGTFGFRGEALSSLCALSDLTVVTRSSSQEVATRIEYDANGAVTSRTHVAREMGTTVCLQRLFHSLPVRYREFQKNLKKEFTKMVHVLQGYCIVSTGIRISCHNVTSSNKKQLILATNGNATIKENLMNMFGAKQIQNLVEVISCDLEDVRRLGEEFAGVTESSFNMFRLSGYISRCNHGYGRSSTDRQFFFINKRPCDHSKVCFS
jgi:DNA mismatch repair protein PMS2